MDINAIKLNTAGALPSSRTEDIVGDVLKYGTNIDTRVELAHTWAHYQSLEFMLNSMAHEPETTVKIMAKHFFPAMEHAPEAELKEFAEMVGVVLRFVAGPAINAAYKAAHNALHRVNQKTSPFDGLKLEFAMLDFSDPAREISDEEIKDFFEPTAE